MIQQREAATIDGRPIRFDDCAHHWHQISDETTEDGVRQTYHRCCHCNSVQMQTWAPWSVAEAAQRHGQYRPLAPGEKRPRRRARRPVAA
jgi:hypothetical protein